MACEKRHCRRRDEYRGDNETVDSTVKFTELCRVLGHGRYGTDRACIETFHQFTLLVDLSVCAHALFSVL